MAISFKIGDPSLFLQYHPAQNVKKMSEGIPLTDADRWDWLVLLRQKAVEKLAAGYDGVVLTCSALKRKYRDVIRIAAYNDHDVIVRFIYLRANEKVLLERVRARKGHYMKASMVKSQINSLEEPDESEIDVLSVDVSGSLSSVQGAALAKVEESLGED
jgi:gluconokinase